MKVLLALVTLTLIATTSTAAHAQEISTTACEVAETAPSGPFGTDGAPTVDQADTAVQTCVVIEVTTEPVFNPGSATGDYQPPSEPSEDGSEYPEGHPDANCIEWYQPDADANGSFPLPICELRLVCGSERVDDVLTGRIAGPESSGVYAEYLDLLLSHVATDAYLNQTGFSGEGLSDALLEIGLDDKPTDSHLPVFYWCAHADRDGQQSPILIFDPDPNVAPRFAWDTTIEEQYDIPGASSDLLIQLLAQLDLYDPELATVPPIEKGFTYVQWPTWFWLANPLTQQSVFTTNDTDTVRIDMQAIVEKVDWFFDGELLISCGPEDMVAYNEAQHHPTENKPDCHHVFTQLGTADLSATITYRIEDMVRSRLSRSPYDYPAPDWQLHSAEPSVPLTTTVSDYQIHQIVSVAANPNADTGSDDFITADLGEPIVTGE